MAMCFFVVFSRRGARRVSRCVWRRLGFCFGQLLCSLRSLEGSSLGRLLRVGSSTIWFLCSLRSLWGSLVRRLALQVLCAAQAWLVRGAPAQPASVGALNKLIMLFWLWLCGSYPARIGTARGPLHATYTRTLWRNGGCLESLVLLHLIELCGLCSEAALSDAVSLARINMAA